MKEALVENLRKGNLYDFIANAGWRFDKDQLINLIKELDFAIYSLYGEEELKKVESEVAENIDQIIY